MTISVPQDLTRPGVAELAVPMMVGTGVGSEIRQPLGYAMVGGLALSQALTLYTTPVVYLYLDRLRLRVLGKHHDTFNPEGEAAL